MGLGTVVVPHPPRHKCRGYYLQPERVVNDPAFTWLLVARRWIAGAFTPLRRGAVLAPAFTPG